MVNKQRTVIIGGGVIGSATAFFISRHPNFDPKKHEVVIVEAVYPGCAASGKAGGLLSRTAFPANLGPLSYKLHQQLAKEFDGANKWGFRQVTTMSIEGSDALSDGNTKLPKDLDWIDPDMVEYAETLGKPGDFSQVHPYWLTNFFVQYAKDACVLNVITGKVSQITVNKEGKCNGVVYLSEGASQPEFLEADNVIVTAGPWTSKLISTCPIVGMKVPSITVAPTENVSAYALFTELELKNTGHVAPEIYARQQEIYICGETIDDPLPDYASEIEVDESYGNALFSFGSTLSKNIAGGAIKRRQACYLPVVDSPYTSGPFIGPTNVDGLLLAAGHTCWGINNAPATGLLMSELLLDGSAKSSNIRSLRPSAYFDSSKNVTYHE